MGCTSTSNKTNTKECIKNGGEKTTAETRTYQSKESPPTDNLPPLARKLSARLTGLQDYPAIRQRYKMLDVVGHGKYGVVYKAECKADPSMFFAVKVLKCTSQMDKKSIMDEVKIIKDLDHPNILKYYEQMEDGPYIFIVTEYCSGGELLERISSKEQFKESEAAGIFEKLLKAINHCHSKNIAHRDLKPENILYSSRDEHAEIKLIDFGLAKKSDRYLKTYQTMVGTPYYIAPEVIDGNYTYSCDVWSLGIILHIMLSGYMPFSGSTDEEVFRSIKKGKLSFENPVWEKVTPPGKDLILKLLEPDENKRLTAAEALEHEWFRLVKSYSPEIDVLDTTIMKSMKKYQGTSKFQKACMNIFVKTLKEEEINNLIVAFNLLDKEKNGYIHSNDVLTVFHEYHPEIDISDLAKRMAAEGRDVINYSQFIAATMDAKQFLTNERLWALFQYFDVSNNGYLTPEDIKIVLSHSTQQNYSLDDVLNMLKEHKVHETDRINFKHFADIMKKVQATPEEEKLAEVYK